MGIVGSSKLVFSKYQKQAFINQPRNLEWASIIEAIGTIGKHNFICHFKRQKMVS